MLLNGSVISFILLLLFAVAMINCDFDLQMLHVVNNFILSNKSFQ